MNRTEHPTIILGGGFVGLFTALHLEQQNYPHPIILIEQRDRFIFKPLLYELLTGELHLEHICPSYTQLLSGSRVSFVQDSITEINLEQRWVKLSSGKGYNYGWKSRENSVILSAIRLIPLLQLSWRISF